MRLLLFLLALLGPLTVQAQNMPYQHHTERERNPSDTSGIQHFFRSGSFYGHSRYFFLHTDNAEGLSDYSAHAFGMGIGYETPRFYGFKVGVSGFFIYNLHSSDLRAADAKTGQTSRYEIGLFDIQNPSNYSDLDRLEDLYVQYEGKIGALKFGKQDLKTPFINPQDGRMRATLVEGLTFQKQLPHGFRLEAGYLYHISPRSTIRWFGIGESVGVYPVGLSPAGGKSLYSGHINSEAVLFGTFSYKGLRKQDFQLHHLWVDNVLSTSLLQYVGQHKLAQGYALVTGVQALAQTAVGQGGNANPLWAYAPANHRAFAFGSRLGLLTPGGTSVMLNYTRITPDGRYLMPREWGRDPFFTFLPRERNEGFADVNAWNVTAGRSLGKSGFRLDVAYGQYHLPDASNAALNKYAMPSYWQMNVELKYHASNWLKGLDLQLLYVYKGQINTDYGMDKYVINKVDMGQLNVVVNFNF